MINELSGRILKGIGGFYYVSTEEGVFECRARGLFRKQNITPLVGDNVILRSIDEINKTAMLFEILPRKNCLIRPAVSNVDSLIAVISVENPRPNLFLLDKVIASAEKASIDIVICINKTDISDAGGYKDIYVKAGFKVIDLSAKTGENIDMIKAYMKDKVNVFAGNSGVGKSSIINSIFGDEIFETGEISKKAERGKHTTRHSELRELPFGGFIIDTPGFGTIELEGDNAKELSDCFREFEEYKSDCKYLDCSHRCEEGCLVIEAVKTGKISKSRYDSYCAIYEEFMNTKK